MARSNVRTSKRAPKDLGRRIKKKPCQLCKDHVEWVDYKNAGMLKRYMSERGKIRARRVSGNCEQHQRDIAQAIKTARELALLPYTQRTVTERRGGRGRDRGRGAPRETEERTVEIEAPAAEDVEAQADGEEAVADEGGDAEGGETGAEPMAEVSGDAAADEEADR
jgi:small subunit ribosomal protein S18